MLNSHKGLHSFSLILVISLAAMLLSGCTVQTPTSPVTDNSEEAGESTNEADASVLTLSDIVNNGMAGTYVYHESSDEVEYIDAVVELGYYLANDSDSNYNDYIYLGVPDTTPLSFDRNSDAKIIVVGSPNSDNARVVPIRDSGYCYSEAISSLSIFDEINGTTFETAEEGESLLTQAGLGVMPLDEGGVLITSSSSEASFSWGQYQGTDFAEGTELVNTPYYIETNYGYYGASDAPYYYNNGYDVPYIQTKNGYFEVDLSNIEPGLYELVTYQDPDAGDYADSFVINIM